jgi:hypothetical protein
MARALPLTRTQALSVYLIIDGDQTLICRHTIKKYDITNDTGKDKWTIINSRGTFIIFMV